MNSGGQVTPSVSATAFLLAEQTAEATVRGDPGVWKCQRVFKILTPLGSAGSRGQISGSGDRKGLGYALGPLPGGVLISVGGYAPHTRVRLGAELTRAWCRRWC
jgi:hypothetical protein